LILVEGKPSDWPVDQVLSALPLVDFGGGKAPSDWPVDPILSAPSRQLILVEVKQSQIGELTEFFRHRRQLILGEVKLRQIGELTEFFRHLVS
jgi:hypothetical protein